MSAAWITDFSRDVQRWCVFWSVAYPEKLSGRLRVTLSLLVRYCGLRATLNYRISRALHARNVRFLPGAISRHNLMRYGLDIPASVIIGPGLYIPHPVGTVVMAMEPIGANLTLISGITIGTRNGNQFPSIGDNVFVGAGARILGGVCIGNGASIGANAVVLCDVPEGSIAVGVPATIKAAKTI